MMAQVRSVTAARAAATSPNGTKRTGADQRSEALAVFRLAGDAERAQRAAVKAVFERDDLDAIGLLRHDGLIAARQLERGLVGLGPRVAEEHAARERAPGQRLGERELRLDVIQVRDVQQARGPARAIASASPGCPWPRTQTATPAVMSR